MFIGVWVQSLNSESLLLCLLHWMNAQKANLFQGYFSFSDEWYCGGNCSLIFALSSSCSSHCWSANTTPAQDQVQEQHCCWWGSVHLEPNPLPIEVTAEILSDLGRLHSSSSLGFMTKNSLKQNPQWPRKLGGIAQLTNLLAFASTKQMGDFQEQGGLSGARVCCCSEIHTVSCSHWALF